MGRKPPKAGDTFTNESGDLVAYLHTDEMMDGSVYTVTARISDDSLLLTTSEGKHTFLLPRGEALVLYKAIAQKWPLDALGDV